MQLCAKGLKPSETEVVEQPTRRQFTTEYKLRILREAEQCASPWEVGALLRREGLYSSHLTTWRKQLDAGAFASMLAKRRGRAAQSSAQARERERLRRKLEQAEKIIEVQKNSPRCSGSRWSRRPRVARGADEGGE